MLRKLKSRHQVKPFWPQRCWKTQWLQVSLPRGPVTLRPLLNCRGLGQRGEGNWCLPGGVLALRPREAGLLGAGTAPDPGADAPAPGKYPVALPEKFDGTLASFPMFFAQAKLYIQGRARNFPDDRTKVHFLISLLKDQAAKWALPLLRQDSPLLTDYVGFCNHLETVFGNPLKESQANRAIRQLRQDKSTAAAYATEFRLLAQDLSWNDSALRDQYLEGLSDEILDQLAMMDRPTTLDALIQRSLQIDDRLEDRRQARDHQHSRLLAPVLPSRSTPTAELPVEPTQLGAARPRLSPSEKTRRPKARRKETEGSGGSASEESRKEETQGAEGPREEQSGGKGGVRLGY
uniref:DUF4939 domain-containing protein n=1 Tax=Podarcis muralis TaxID=64176 RepID=A0A670JH06_PODMU